MTTEGRQNTTPATVGRVGNDEDAQLIVHEVGGVAPGPTLSVLAGIHGDELEGQVALSLVLASLKPQQLRGRLRAVIHSNPPAVQARTRLSPRDGRNLARAFPGSADGTLTERLAHRISQDVITGADLLVDLHSAGTDFAMPFFVGYPRAAGALAAQAAAEFGAELVWEHERIAAGRSLSAALKAGVPCLYVESSGGGSLCGGELDRYVEGMHRLLALLGMTNIQLRKVPAPQLLQGGDGNIDSALTVRSAGWCVTRARPGQAVNRGAAIAEVIDPGGTRQETITAPDTGTLMLLRRRADVRPGDVVAMLGPPPDSR